jgi:hypothetical protein
MGTTWVCGGCVGKSVAKLLCDDLCADERNQIEAWDALWSLRWPLRAKIYERAGRNDVLFVGVADHGNRVDPLEAHEQLQRVMQNRLAIELQELFRAVCFHP